MLTAMLRRLALTLVTLFGLSIVCFLLVRMVPGDTAEVLLGMNYTPERAEQLREELGLNRSWPEQYVVWLTRFVQGDWGTSVSGQPVVDEIAAAAPVTIQLALMAAVFATIVGVPLGIAAAVRTGYVGRFAVFTLSLVGLSVPGFWLGTLFILAFALKLLWLPSGGSVPIWVDPLESLRHMILPSIALGLAVAAVLARMTRSAVDSVIRSDYVRTARAKGVSGRVVLFKHVLRNALPPIFTIAGLQVGYLLGGSVVIEEVFSLPGLGRLVLRALGERDYPLLQACLLLIGTSFVLVNLAVDLLNRWAAPQLREEA
jgi:peptide/nickel transport system permease protein